ncbi:hypothetical protein [Lentzea aerocolonigenes]|uniref:hypothetical protein n=1 Tax=Lentzea aerocolonigenes TaxID=68170 RepID=UPI000B2CA1F0|nr:hypothetical protein [Lentzea aerocolonigenes]MCP2249651.1 hypothetical protein [Lentzea aerocolonigenes]
MAEKEDDWVRIQLPGGSSVPVRRGSPVEAAFGTSPVPAPTDRMQWSIGLLGDFLWLNLPECRPFFAEQIKAEVEQAIDHDRELRPLQPMDIADYVLWQPLIEPALEARPMDEQWVSRLLRVVREAWELEPPPWEDTRYGLRVYVLERLDVPEHLPVVERLDPALYAAIRAEIGS